MAPFNSTLISDSAHLAASNNTNGIQVQPSYILAFVPLILAQLTTDISVYLRLAHDRPFLRAALAAICTRPLAVWRDKMHLDDLVEQKNDLVYTKTSLLLQRLAATNSLVNRHCVTLLGDIERSKFYSFTGYGFSVFFYVLAIYALSMGLSFHFAYSYSPFAAKLSLGVYFCQLLTGIFSVPDRNLLEGSGQRQLHVDRLYTKIKFHAKRFRRLITPKATTLQSEWDITTTQLIGRPPTHPENSDTGTVHLEMLPGRVRGPYYSSESAWKVSERMRKEAEHPLQSTVVPSTPAPVSILRMRSEHQDRPRTSDERKQTASRYPPPTQDDQKQPASRFIRLSLYLLAALLGVDTHDFQLKGPMKPDVVLRAKIAGWTSAFEIPLVPMHLGLIPITGSYAKYEYSFANMSSRRTLCSVLVGLCRYLRLEWLLVLGQVLCWSFIAAQPWRAAAIIGGIQVGGTLFMVAGVYWCILSRTKKNDRILAAFRLADPEVKSGVSSLPSDLATIIWNGIYHAVRSRQVLAKQRREIDTNGPKGEDHIATLKEELVSHHIATLAAILKIFRREQRSHPDLDSTSRRTCRIFEAWIAEAWTSGDSETETDPRISCAEPTVLFDGRLKRVKRVKRVEDANPDCEISLIDNEDGDDDNEDDDDVFGDKVFGEGERKVEVANPYYSPQSRKDGKSRYLAAEEQEEEAPVTETLVV